MGAQQRDRKKLIIIPQNRIYIVFPPSSLVSSVEKSFFIKKRKFKYETHLSCLLRIKSKGSAQTKTLILREKCLRSLLVTFKNILKKAFHVRNKETRFLLNFF